jgi:hypothetical protein
MKGLLELSSSLVAAARSRNKDVKTKAKVNNNEQKKDKLLFVFSLSLPLLFWCLGFKCPYIYIPIKTFAYQPRARSIGNILNISQTLTSSIQLIIWVSKTVKKKQQSKKYKAKYGIHDSSIDK